MTQHFALHRELSDAQAGAALDRAVAQVRRNLPDFTYKAQNHSSVGNVYPAVENDQWTAGFWPGEIWLAYERTGDKVFQHAAQIQVQSFLNRIEHKIAVDHHDMGFLYSPSCVAAWQLVKDTDGKRAALLAADQLLRRYHPVGRFLQAWGEMGARENHRYIIDCLLNTPLLYWATQETGDLRYRGVALAHTRTCLANSIRPDNSTYHTFFMDPVTGEPDHGETCQGYKNDSAWARGQAWAVYGFALAYRHDPHPDYKDAFERVLDFYLSRLPEDLVPYWDLTFTSGEEEPRDSSSASIVACGLLEMASLLSENEDCVGSAYERLARQMMKSLVDTYAVKDTSASNGQVLHGTYSKKSPYNTCTPEGVDECVAWGDYFYMEALTRLTSAWHPYW